MRVTDNKTAWVKHQLLGIFWTHKSTRSYSWPQVDHGTHAWAQLLSLLTENVFVTVATLGWRSSNGKEGRRGEGGGGEGMIPCRRRKNSQQKTLLNRRCLSASDALSYCGNHKENKGQDNLPTLSASNSAPSHSLQTPWYKQIRPELAVPLVEHIYNKIGSGFRDYGDICGGGLQSAASDLQALDTSVSRLELHPIHRPLLLPHYVLVEL